MYDLARDLQVEEWHRSVAHSTLVHLVSCNFNCAVSVNNLTSYSRRQ